MRDEVCTLHRIYQAYCLWRIAGTLNSVCLFAFIFFLFHLAKNVCFITKVKWVKCYGLWVCIPYTLELGSPKSSRLNICGVEIRFFFFIRFCCCWNGRCSQIEFDLMVLFNWNSWRSLAHVSLFPIYFAIRGSYGVEVNFM